MPPASSPPFVSDARLRTAPASRVIEHLVLHGWERAQRDADPAGVREEVRAALARWRGAGLPAVADGDGGFRYDPGEVFLFMRWAGREGADPFWRPHHVAIERARVLSWHPPGTPRDRPPDTSALPPRRLVVSLQRSFDPLFLAPGARVRLPLPYPDGATHDVDVALDPLAVEGIVRQAPGHMELQVTAAPAGVVTLGARMTFTASAYAPAASVVPLAAVERDLYLRDREELVHVTPAIVALTARVTEGVHEPRQKLHRIFDYLLDGCNWGPFPYECLDAQEPLNIPPESGWFDCRLGSAMLAAMCRAAGLPARRLSGYLLYAECAGYHWWVQAWLPDEGWVPVDTWGGELSASGRDGPWRDVFFGALDYRLTSEVLPRSFNRSPGVRMPAVWRVLERDVDGATEIAAVDLATGRDIWVDRIRVETSLV